MPTFCTHDTCDWLVGFFFWRSCDDVPGKLESLYCEFKPGHEYPTDSGCFKDSLKRIHYKRKINVQSIRFIIVVGATLTGEGVGVGGGASFLAKTFLISSRS